MIEGVLFDLDGVLVDACEWHQAAFNEALSRIVGFELSQEEHDKKFNGLSSRQKLEILKDQNQITAAEVEDIHSYKQDITHRMIERLAKPDPVKIELMKNLRDLGIKVGCVTNCIRKSAELMLASSQLLIYIECLVSNEDVKNPKPDPEGYLQAMERLKLKPRATLILEDSEHGISAAMQAKTNLLIVKSCDEVTWPFVEKRLQR